MFEIFSENAFRLLGLPVTATKREIIRRFEDMQTLMKIGHEPHYDTDLSWIIEINRNEETIIKALHLLENPKTRILHFLSWFWLIDEHDFNAINALNNKDVSGAILIWSNAAKQKNSHHIKNLATVEFILASIDTEHDYLHLKNGINLWSEFISSGRFSNFIKNADPELSKKFTNVDFTNFTGNYLNKIIIPILNKWSDETQLKKIKDFFSVLNLSKLPPNIVSVIKEKYINPLLDKINNICDGLSDIGDDYETLYSETKNFIRKITPLFELIKQTGNDFLIEHTGDKIVNIILDRAIHYSNNTNEWEKGIALCESAKEFIIGPLVKERLEKNLNVFCHNIDQKKLWEGLEPITVTPFLGTIFGIGTKLYGTSNVDPYSMSYEATRYFVIFFIPVIPLGRYRVRYIGDNKIEFLGRIPFRTRDNFHLSIGTIFILFSLFYFILEVTSNDYHSERRTLPSTAPSSYIYENLQSKNDSSKRQEIETLKNKIFNARNKLIGLKSEILSLEESLKKYDLRLNELKENIGKIEKRYLKGFSVDENKYREYVAEYNNLLQKYNINYSIYDTKINEYNSLVDIINKDIERYKRLVGDK